MAHFLGKRNLEVYTARVATVSDLEMRPEIKVFAVSSESYKVPKWKEFERVIRDALGNALDEEETEIINNLKAMVLTGKQVTYQLLDSFRRIMNEELEFYSLYMHCEAVIAAILLCRRDQSTVSSTDPESNPESIILADISEVLCLVSEHEFFTHVFPELSRRYSFCFKVMLPCMLGTLPSSWEGKCSSWL